MGGQPCRLHVCQGGPGLPGARGWELLWAMPYGRPGSAGRQGKNCEFLGTHRCPHLGHPAPRGVPVGMWVLSEPWRPL